MRVTGESFEQALAALEGRAAGTGPEDRTDPDPGAEEAGEPGEAGSAAVIDLAGRERRAGAARETRRRTPARPRRAPGAANGQQEERG